MVVKENSDRKKKKKTSILAPNLARITSVHLASIKHSKNPFGVNLKQASHINLWNHIALLYVMLFNTHPTDPTTITPDSKATSPSPAS